jgi:hypothetical protein
MVSAFAFCTVPQYNAGPLAFSFFQYAVFSRFNQRFPRFPYGKKSMVKRKRGKT